MDIKSLRTGIGYDVHKVAPGYKMILGGVTFDHPVGLVGHSDADVCLHAITDALLSAAGLGDIGQLFPDTEQANANLSSRIFLKETGDLLRKHQWQIINIDSVIICDRPKIAPVSLQMRTHIATDLQIDIDRIQVKGKTSEGLGFIGEAKGIESYATCLVVKNG